MSKSSGTKEKDMNMTEKLRHFFFKTNASVDPLRDPSSAQNSSSSNRQEYIVTQDILKEISPDASPAQRIKALKELADIVTTFSLSEDDIKNLVAQTIDVLNNSLTNSTASISSERSTNSTTSAISSPPSLPSNTTLELRQTVWQFYINLVKGQQDRLLNMRELFFKLIKDLSKDCSLDIWYRIELLAAITDCGQHLSKMEDEIAELMLSHFSEVTSAPRPKTVVLFLSILGNIFKNHSFYLTDQMVCDLIRKVCDLFTSTSMEEELDYCLLVFNVAVKMGIPSNLIEDLTKALCKGSNIANFKDKCDDVIKELMKTHLGHSVVCQLVSFLEDPLCRSDPGVLCGSIHFLKISLWEKPSNLKHQPKSILQPFSEVLHCKSIPVAIEIISSVFHLISRDDLLLSNNWILVLDILDILTTKYEISVPILTDGTISGKSDDLSRDVHKLINHIDDLIQKKQFYGPKERFYSIKENCYLSLPEASVFRLIEYRSQSISPFDDRGDWIECLTKLMEKFFKMDNRSSVRIKALTALSRILHSCRHENVDLVIDYAVVPFLSNIDSENDSKVRNQAVELLIDLIDQCYSARRVIELLELTGKFLTRWNKIRVTDANDIINVMSEREIIAINSAISGLISVFKVKLFVTPASPAVEAFKLIVNHLNAHYSDYVVFGPTGSTIRQEIFSFLLSLRANPLGQIAVSGANILTQEQLFYEHLNFSPYLHCPRTSLNLKESLYDSPYSTFSQPTSATVSPPPTPSSITSGARNYIPDTYVSLNALFKVIISCLEQEKDWSVLKLVLIGLPNLLKNKALVLLSDESESVKQSIHDIFKCCQTLFYDSTKTIPDCLSNKPVKLTKSEFQSYIIPILSTLITYKELDSTDKTSLIKIFQNGLMPRQCTVGLCISALTLCTLEMKEAMLKMLPGVILSLSKISATLALAIPMLEFLSNIILLPSLYKNFVSDQYMSIFAIALPYTNPLKFNEYTVGLAHRTIAMWFLKCRLQFRKDFVQFIIKGLQANIMQPLEESRHEDQRKRSSSLSTDTLINKKSFESRLPNASAQLSTHHHHHVHQLHSPLTPSSPSPISPSKNSIFLFPSLESPNQVSLTNANLKSSHSNHTLQMELIEACMDLLARYVAGMSSTVPNKSQFVELFMDRSRNHTWLVGNQLITITTSGCGSRAFVNGLCDKCFRVCKTVSEAGLDNSTEAINSKRENYNTSVGKEGFLSARRRHQSAMQPSSATNKPLSRAYDDTHVGEKIPQNGDIHTTTDQSYCVCWCQGWAEILVRRPTGNTSWIIRIENQVNTFSYSSSPPDLPLPELSLITHPHTVERIRKSCKNALSLSQDNSDDEVFAGSLKRANSSPEIEKIGLVDDIKAEEAKEELNHKTKQKVKRVLTSSSSETVPTLSRTTSVGKADIPLSLVTRSQSFTSKPTGVNSSSISRIKGKLNHLDLKNSVENKESPKFHPVSPKSPASKAIDDIPASSNSVQGHRDRVHTISVMTQIQKPIKKTTTADASVSTTGISPSFVFLQLYYSAAFGPAKENPLLLPKTDVVDRSLKLFDLITPYETHKIGIVYIMPGQVRNITAILGNQSGSQRYMEFLKGIGKLVLLESVDPLKTYVGGLSLNGQDGKFAYCWQDNLTQVIFHVATLMPSRERDPEHINKKSHIGNDFVLIAYNDSTEALDMADIKGDGQFTYVCIVITPLEYNSNLVVVQTRQDLTEMFGHSEPIMLTDKMLPIFVRQLALHGNLASQIFKSRQQSPSPAGPYVSNWVERLRQMKRIKQKVIEHNTVIQSKNAPGSIFGVTTPTTATPGKTIPGKDDDTSSSGSHNSNKCERLADQFPEDFTIYI